MHTSKEYYQSMILVLFVAVCTLVYAIYFWNTAECKYQITYQEHNYVTGDIYTETRCFNTTKEKERFIIQNIKDRDQPPRWDFEFDIQNLNSSSSSISS
jgi:hypothetical protein